MKNSLINDAKLDSCMFVESDLRNIQCGRYPDLIGHTKQINSIAFSPDSKYLVSGSFDKTVKLWSVNSQDTVVTLKGHSDSIKSVAFSPSGNYFAYASDRNTIVFWDIEL
jgi:WD40 repeat protein